MTKPSKGTLIRTVLLLLALTNQMLTIAGYSPLPFGDAQVELLISTVWTVAAAIAGWWKNNSFTPEAMEVDKILRKLKKNPFR